MPTTNHNKTVPTNPLTQWEHMIEAANEAFERRDNPLALMCTPKHSDPYATGKAKDFIKILLMRGFPKLL